MAATYLDGRLIGRQGGFDPYRLQLRAQKFDTPALTAGEHEWRVELLEARNGLPLMMDYSALDSAGERVICLSDNSWTAARDGALPLPVVLHAKQQEDGAAWHLWRRPHALPGAAWLEGAQPDVVLDLSIAPPGVTPVSQTFSWMIPPGATALQLNLSADAVVESFKVDGASASLMQGRCALPIERAAARPAELVVSSRELGGGVFTDVANYEFGRGKIHCVSWQLQGLQAYSGAIRMTQNVSLRTLPRRLRLNLGMVRGSVEAFCNGQSIGVRVMPPFIFDASRQATRGENKFELVVANTLANFLSSWSPTRGWSSDQLHAGVFGPVTLEVEA